MDNLLEYNEEHINLRVIRLNVVVESRVPRKKSRGGVGMFQYAQTVEESDWAARQKEIQVCSDPHFI